MQTQLTQLIENIRSASQPNDIDRVVCDVKRVLLEAAEPNKVVSKKSKQRKQRKQPRTHQSPWYDKECESARKMYNSLRNQYSRTHLDEDKVKRDEAKKIYVKLCKKKSISHDERLTNSLLASKFGDTRNYWKQIKPPQIDNTEYVSAEQFRDHFSSLFEVRNEDAEKHDYSQYTRSVDVLDDEFTIEEIDQAVKHLKRGKAAGNDDIKSDYILCEHNNLKYVMKELFNKLYSIGFFPTEWSTGVIVPIHKRGDKNNPQNYRGITLTSTMSKIFTYLLNRRLGHWCDDNKILSEGQFAYKPGYGTVDAVFVLKCMFDSHRSGAHYAFIDYSKAFDLIDRGLLYNKLLNFGISSKFLKIIMNMYSKTSSKVRTASRMSDPFNLECGVMQGECLSPSFFALHINEIKSKMNEIPSMGLMFGDRKISVLKYADDLVLCAKTSEGLQAGLNALYEFCTTNSLTVNTEKSKVMYVSSKKSKKLPILSYNHKALQFVDSFKYLGINISRTGKLTEGLTNVCQQADRAQTVLDLHILKHPSVSVNHIFELFDCLLKPILMYGCEIYGAHSYGCIESFHLKFMKHILDVKLSTNSTMIYAETGRYPFSVHINKCMLKFWFKILNSDHEKLIYIVYHHLLTSNVKCEWLTHIKKILCTNGFPYVWENQGVLNEKQFLCLFEQRSKDIFIQECLSDISLSPRCRMYKEIKPTFGGELYLEMNINTRLRSCLT